MDQALSLIGHHKIDICWVPCEKIICVLTPPTAATASGRKYSIAKKDLVYIENHHN